MTFLFTCRRWMLVFITSSGDEQKHHFQFLPVLYSLSIYILRWHDTRRRIEVFLGGFWSWKMIGEKKCLSPTTVKFWLYYYLSKLTTCGQSVRPILREVSEIQLRNSLPDCLSLTINNYIVFTKKIHQSNSTQLLLLHLLLPQQRRDSTVDRCHLLIIIM